LGDLLGAKKQSNAASVEHIYCVSWMLQKSKGVSDFQNYRAVGNSPVIATFSQRGDKQCCRHIIIEIFDSFVEKIHQKEFLFLRSKNLTRVELSARTKVT